MWYNKWHENTHFYPLLDRERPTADPSRVALVGCLCPASLSNFASPRPRRAGHHDCQAAGLAVLQEGSSRPHHLHTSFSEEGLQQLKDLLHRRPSDFGKERSTWTLELAAQVSFEQGIISVQVSDESVRRALKRLKTNWKRAKHWITSPDPQYLLKKTHATA